MKRFLNRHRIAGGATRGFTLIELLVVIAVIALLAALLLPALKQARLKGRIATCLSNMRQLGIGVYLYADDNSGYFPQNGMNCTNRANLPGDTGNGFYEGTHTWMPSDARMGDGTISTYSGIGLVWPYVKSPRTFYCPANSKSAEWLETSWYGRGSTTDWYVMGGGYAAAASKRGFGVQGKGSICTYTYRNGMYPFGGGNAGPTQDDFARRLGESDLEGRAMLTDFWPAFNGAVLVPDPAIAPPHGSDRTVAVLGTDGHAGPFKIPSGVIPIWNVCQFLAAPNQADYGNGWGAQISAWWLIADNAIR